MRWLVGPARAKLLIALQVLRTSQHRILLSLRAAVNSRRPSLEKLTCVTPPVCSPSCQISPGVFSNTLMSPDPRNNSRNIVKRTGYLEKLRRKLTSDVGRGIENHQVREVLQNADVTLEGAGEIRER